MTNGWPGDTNNHGGWWLEFADKKWRILPTRFGFLWSAIPRTRLWCQNDSVVGCLSHGCGDHLWLHPGLECGSGGWNGNIQKQICSDLSSLLFLKQIAWWTIKLAMNQPFLSKTTNPYTLTNSCGACLVNGSTWGITWLCLSSVNTQEGLSIIAVARHQLGTGKSIFHQPSSRIGISRGCWPTTWAFHGATQLVPATCLAALRKC